MIKGIWGDERLGLRGKTTTTSSVIIQQRFATLYHWNDHNDHDDHQQW